MTLGRNFTLPKVMKLHPFLDDLINFYFQRVGQKILHGAMAAKYTLPFKRPTRVTNPLTKKALALKRFVSVKSRVRLMPKHKSIIWLFVVILSTQSCFSERFTVQILVNACQAEYEFLISNSRFFQTSSTSATSNWGVLKEMGEFSDWKLCRLICRGSTQTGMASNKIVVFGQALICLCLENAISLR